MTLATLALVIAVGLVGPLLAPPDRLRVPVVVGELAAGVIVGRTGLHWIHPGDPVLAFLASAGFAVVMLVTGSAVPVRDRTLRPAAGRGTLLAVVCGVAAVPAGYAVAAVAGTGHGALYAVLIASSSAAVMMPVVAELRLSGPDVLAATVQVALADIAAIVALPLVEDPTRAGRAALGALAVAGAGLVILVVMLQLRHRGVIRRLHRLSKRRNLGLELRWNLLIVFGLAGLAEHLGVSIVLAGFVAGLILAAQGEPRRLARQLFAVGDGFLSPVFFVWLGASIYLRDLFTHPRLVLLVAALVAASLLVRLLLVPLHQPLTLAVLSSAQLGVPIAAVTIGARNDLLVPGEGGAIVSAALISVLVIGLTASRARRRLDRERAAG